MTSRRTPAGRGTPRELVVGHLVANYLHLTEHWIHDQATSVPRATPVILNRGRRIDPGCYPIARACHLDDLTPAQHRREADGWERHHHSAHFRRACLRYGCDVLHAHFGTEGVLHVGLARSLRIPLVTSFYGYDVGALPRDERWASGLRTLFAHGTLFVAEGPFMAESLESLGCSPDRIRIVPLPVGGRRPRIAKRENPGEPVILICGRLVEKKGVDDSVRALARVRALHPRLGFRAVIVGDGPERERIERLVSTLGLTDVVSMRGSVPHESLVPILATARVVLQMSRTATDGDCEGGAPVLLGEAQALGVPVVATRHCDIPSTVADGASGFLVASGDAASAADRIAGLLADASLASRMGASGRRRMRRERSSHACGQQLRRCYEEAITRTAGARRGRPAFVRASLGLLIDLRRTAGDVGGLMRLASRSPDDDPERLVLLQALADAQRRAGSPLDAAGTYRRLSRASPDEIYAHLAEAECWLQGGAPARAVGSFARFVSAQRDTDYALARVASVLVEHGCGPGVLLRVARRVIPASGVFVAVVSHLRSFLEPSVSGVSRRRLHGFIGETVARDLPALSARPAGPTSDRERVEFAVADLLLLATGAGWSHALDRVDAVFPLTCLRGALPMYRVASLLERGSDAQRAMAKRLFARVTRHRTATAEIRGGACFHLARMARDERRCRTGLTLVRRCLQYDSNHAGARQLRAELRAS